MDEKTNLKPETRAKINELKAKLEKGGAGEEGHKALGRDRNTPKPSGAEIIKRPVDYVQIERSSHYWGLRDVKTGLATRSTLALEEMWLLRLALNQFIVKNPRSKIFRYKDGSFDCVDFTFSSTDVRKATRSDFSNESQVEHFRNLRVREIVHYYEWDEKKGEKGGWVRKSAEEAFPIFAISRIVDSKPLGARRKADKRNTQLDFFGVFNPIFGDAIQNNLLFDHKYYIPELVCRMRRGAQILYNQALPFVHKHPIGFELGYLFACNLLSRDLRFVKQNCQYIQGCLKEVVGLTRWHLTPPKTDSREAVWHLKAGKSEEDERLDEFEKTHRLT